MKYKRDTWKGLLFIAGLVVALASCRKIMDEWNVLYHVPQSCVCDVASYGPGYDINFNLPYPYYFQKYYSPSGNVKEIDLYFENLIYPPDLPYQRYLVDDQGKKVYIRNKDNPGELLMTIYLNNDKRVDSFRLTRLLGYPPEDGYPLWNGFEYKNGRLWVIKGFFDDDTCHYDYNGNLLSMKHYDDYNGDYNGFFFTYDYSRQAKQQYYKFGLHYNNGFQLLEYLGYFPEITNPKNLMIHFHQGVENSELGIYDKDIYDHHFDDKGKLTSFKFGLVGYPADAQVYTLTWNCR